MNKVTKSGLSSETQMFNNTRLSYCDDLGHVVFFPLLRDGSASSLTPATFSVNRILNEDCLHKHT